MFRKLVSNLPYSPSVITDISFYAQRLRHEDVTRRLTVLFVALTLIMQSLAVFSPPESANASSEQDIVRGGVTDLNDYLVRYDANEDDLKDILSTLGVSRTDLTDTIEKNISVKKDMYIMSRFGQLSGSDQEVSLPYKKSTGGMDVRYFSPTASLDMSHGTLRGWVGNSQNIGWFAVIKSNGSILTKGVPSSLSVSKVDTSSAVKTLSARNITQSKPAETVAANTSDKISYTLTLSNPQKITSTASFTIRISDILEYANLIDAGGADYNPSTQTLSWPPVTLKAGQSNSKVFVVQVMQILPETTQGLSNPESYDCELTAAFGNSHTTSVNCPAIKGVESIVNQLPFIGTTGNVVFIAALSLIVLFFAIRTRMLKKELRILRHNFNTGAI